jgi:hypothetical protein
MDSDVIWFQNPQCLFDSPLYKSEKALFFRDRKFYRVPKLFLKVFSKLPYKTSVDHNKVNINLYSGTPFIYGLLHFYTDLVD